MSVYTLGVCVQLVMQVCTLTYQDFLGTEAGQQKEIGTVPPDSGQLATMNISLKENNFPDFSNKRKFIFYRYM